MGVFDGRGVIVFAGVVVWVGVGVCVTVGVNDWVCVEVIVVVTVVVGDSLVPQPGKISKAIIKNNKRVAFFAVVRGIASFQT